MALIRLADVLSPPDGVQRYDVTSNGERLAIVAVVDQAPSPVATVVVNLFGQLRARDTVRR